MRSFWRAPGLSRLGLLERATETLDAERCIPAVGQGALALELRAADQELNLLVGQLSDPETTIAVAAERGVLEAVQGSCQLPVAAHARRCNDRMRLDALLAEPDGSRVRQRERAVDWPAKCRRSHGLDRTRAR